MKKATYPRDWDAATRNRALENQLEWLKRHGILIRLTDDGGYKILAGGNSWVMDLYFEFSWVYGFTCRMSDDYGFIVYKEPEGMTVN